MQETGVCGIQDWMILFMATGYYHQHWVGSGFEELAVGCLDTWVDCKSELDTHPAMVPSLSPEDVQEG